ncbi:MAG: hypothetical protein R3247_12995 [Rhodothermales bacterium]|nr:hypothetical protein [Rhodothermales bacterium]
MHGTTIQARWEAFAESAAGRLVLRLLRLGFVGAVVALLVHQVSGIGWAELWAARPRTPWFYVIWAVLYFQLPLTEGLIYRGLWQVPLRAVLPVVLSKRVLNADVVSYSGEAYLYLKMRRRVGRGDRFVLGSIKDHAIGSALGSTLAVVLVVGGFLYTGQITLVGVFGGQAPWYVAGGVGMILLLGAVAVRFRKTLFTLPRRQVFALFAIHFVRFVAVVYVLQILQWWVVVPAAPMSVWGTMLAVQAVANRLPLVPAKDLVAIGAILGMSGLLEASAAAIAAMLLTRSLLDKALNLFFFVLTALRSRHDPPEPAAGDDSETSDAVTAPKEPHRASPVEL